MTALERQLQASVNYYERKKVNAIELHKQSEMVERVVIQGDLSRLSPTERSSYYAKVCESLGLNPFTRPFEYLKLNGREILYARKDCTDQLRKIHNVSITIVSREKVEDIYIVTARATLPSGRTDESIGAVTVKGLSGEALANALMKSESKSKRRATLSVCGMAFLDETEVETIPEAQSLPRITSHQDEPDFVHVETGAFEELSARLSTLENDLAGCDSYDRVLALREMLGSKAKQSPLTKEIQAAGERNELDAEQRKALGKTWQRISRQVEKLEASIKAPDVAASFIDADPEQDGR